MAQNKAPGQPVQIKASDEKLAGKYANMMQVSHTREEFVLDFVNLIPPSGQLVSRVLISPAHAKRIVAALTDNIKKYETQFQKIAEEGADKPNFGFKTE